MSDFSSIKRNAKNKIYKYSLPQIKIREATSNDPWNPSSDVMVEIATLTYDPLALEEMIVILMKRLNDYGKNWRHVYKSLMLLQYMCLVGDNKVLRFCNQNKQIISSLTNFQYIDKEKRDYGKLVREKGQNFCQLLNDRELFTVEREKHLTACEKVQPHLFAQMKRNSEMAIASKTKSNSNDLNKFPISKKATVSTTDLNNRVVNSTSTNSKARWTMSHDITNAIPKNDSEEEVQLQVALAISKEESEINQSALSTGRSQPAAHLPTPKTVQETQLLDFGTTETFVNPVTIYQETRNPFFNDPFALYGDNPQQTPKTTTPGPSPAYSNFNNNVIFPTSQLAATQETLTKSKSDDLFSNSVSRNTGGNLMNSNLFDKDPPVNFSSFNPFDDVKLTATSQKTLNEMSSLSSNPKFQNSTSALGPSPNLYLYQQQQQLFSQQRPNQFGANQYGGQNPEPQFGPLNTAYTTNPFGQTIPQQSFNQPMGYSQGYNINMSGNQFQQQNQNKPFYNPTRF